LELKPAAATAKAQDSRFTGDVYMNSIHRGEDPSRMIVSLVRFTPGARTNVTDTESAGFRRRAGAGERI
jgi:hypothetical protein